MLYLVVHTVDAITAKVPLSMIMLMDAMKRKAIPAELKLRMVLPTSGMQSMSLWDSADAHALETWLEESLGADCLSQVSEVQEDFMYGFNLELTRLRTGEMVAASSQRTLETVGGKAGQAAQAVGGATTRAISSARQGLEDLDTKTGVITAAKTTTTEAIKSMRGATDKVMQSEAVNQVVTNVGAAAATGWKKVGFGISWVSEQIVAQKRASNSGEEPSEHAQDTARLFAAASGKDAASHPPPQSQQMPQSTQLPTSPPPTVATSTPLSM